MKKRKWTKCFRILSHSLFLFLPLHEKGVIPYDNTARNDGNGTCREHSRQKTPAISARIGPEFLLTHFSQSDSLVLLWDIFLYLFHS